MDDTLSHELDFFLRDDDLETFFKSAIEALSLELFRPFENKFLLCLQSINELNDRLRTTKGLKPKRSVLIQCHPRESGNEIDRVNLSLNEQRRKRTLEYEDENTTSPGRKNAKKKIRKKPAIKKEVKHEVERGITSDKYKKTDEYSLNVIHNVNNIVNNGIVILNNSNILANKSTQPNLIPCYLTPFNNSNLLDKLAVIAFAQKTLLRDFSEPSQIKTSAINSNVSSMPKALAVDPAASISLLSPNQMQTLYAVPALQQPFLQFNANPVIGQFLANQSTEKSVPNLSKFPNQLYNFALNRKHPLPLPQLASLGNSLLLLHPPELTCNFTNEAITLTWVMKDANDVNVSCYLIYFYEENKTTFDCAAWKFLGKVSAIPLPIVVTLKQFSRNNRYHFTVLPVDSYKRNGVFSRPVSISI